MKVFLIRHSEPDYTAVTEAGFSGFGRDLSSLSANGISLAQQCAQSPIFKNVELILSSPYTRALATAAEIVRFNNIPLHIELGLHEWRPDRTDRYLKNGNQAYDAWLIYKKNHGQRTNDNYWDYETSTEVRARALKVLSAYSKYHCLACVTHGEVMRQFGDWQQIKYCEIKTIHLFE
ncbi:histidine phosphatase family protein [Furfurilactobacillus curtus]|uniref:Nickel transporter n=1 Tax=Furfurilactobacillus curtus TaxID=1746200 RepID=A0ABQ5JPS2_9LACO